METSNKKIGEFYGNFNRGQLYLASHISDNRKCGKRLLAIELIGEDMSILIWSKHDPANDYYKILQELNVHYHSDSDLLRWINRASELIIEEVDYDNFTYQA